MVENFQNITNSRAQLPIIVFRRIPTTTATTTTTDFKHTDYRTRYTTKLKPITTTKIKTSTVLYHTLSHHIYSSSNRKNIYTSTKTTKAAAAAATTSNIFTSEIVNRIQPHHIYNNSNRKNIYYSSSKPTKAAAAATTTSKIFSEIVNRIGNGEEEYD